ncbi:ABC-type antimicrobial peptide transport system, ATPase component [Corynebacterium camporealensis]|uniref:ABC-type antimicrobial peptide transport system, ATPase component n=1 Tax=Corynebacterium camporealensis TaxID=161896 RepID=A0A0F6QWE1_9CORY|nr:ABC transporter ATP-binding protein [Corynebacterium camporealensis]AKE38905.1 ABC-type antimicrobial peptide transport system, ATPase component [Corynebacterium camporealensis]AVH88160.1 ABC-type antimicrobial peptide transport system, ATPase component [Corynebacterium camporealensis]
MNNHAQPALHLEDVNVTFGDGDSTVRALDNVNLRIEPGEFVAIVGPSGSGKSTLLAVAGALTTPQSGNVTLGGEDLTRMNDKELARVRREHIGFVFQSGNLPSSLKARDQLELAARLLGQRGRKSNDELLEAVGMSHRANHRPGKLSGGERQRIGIARALVSGPDVLLVDEPTAALDSNRSQEIVKLLAKESHEEGVATVMVSHDMAILEHCDRVLQMEDGKLTAFQAD